MNLAGTGWVLTRTAADVAAAIGLDEPRYGAKHSAFARSSRTGFEAAAVTGLAVATVALVGHPGTRRTATVRFGHSFAAVAVVAGSRNLGPEFARWEGVPVFSAWVTEPERRVRIDFRTEDVAAESFRALGVGVMTDVPSGDNATLRSGVAELCARFGDEYWRRCDQERAYPEEFVRALTEAKYLSALIPTDYGGLGFGLTEATVILETINHSGGNSSACHTQMYTMGALLRYGSDEQKRRYLPDLAIGKVRLQAFSVTEPAAGSNTTAITTFAERTNDGYLVTGHKNWTSRVVESDLLLLLARTRPRSESPSERRKGLSLFLVISVRCGNANPRHSLLSPSARCSITLPTRSGSRGCTSRRRVSWEKRGRDLTT